MTQSPNDDLTRRVIDCVMEVHNQTGPGLTKDVYEACLTLELAAAGLPYESGRVLPLVYDGCELDFRCQTDLIVSETLMVQVEAVDEIEPIHEQKLRTCLWMGSYPAGLLVNFNVDDMADGITYMAAPAPQARPVTHDVFDDPDLGSTF
jgi:GxxExxY protein